MTLPIRFAARETGRNLLRNLIMSVAAVITMAVALSAVGGVLLARTAISNADIQWRGGVQVAIFMTPDATTGEIAKVSSELAHSPTVKTFHFVDKNAAYTEFKTMFANQPALVSTLNAADMPPSFRVVPNNAGQVTALGASFAHQGGVETVAFAQQQISAMLARFARLRTIALMVAIGVSIGALALIANTIAVAVHTRRREVGVMKLIGAPDSAIRLPFMAEGLVCGVLGGAVAGTLTYSARRTIASFVSAGPAVGARSLYVGSHAAALSALTLVGLGAAIGAIGAAVAIRRHLKV